MSLLLFLCCVFLVPILHYLPFPSLTLPVLPFCYIYFNFYLFFLLSFYILCSLISCFSSPTSSCSHPSLLSFTVRCLFQPCTCYSFTILFTPVEQLFYLIPSLPFPVPHLESLLSLTSSSPAGNTHLPWRCTWGRGSCPAHKARWWSSTRFRWCPWSSHCPAALWGKGSRG